MDYMIRRRISKATQIKILKYLEYIHSSAEEGHQKGYNILGLLSKRLRDIVYKEYYGRILMKFSLFNRNFSEKFLKTLSLYLHEITLGPGEILYNQGEIDQRLFFVQNGAIEEFVDLQDNGHKDIILGTIKQGDYFGQYGFLAKMESKSSTRSLNVSQLVSCNLDDFIQVIKQFPNDYEVYCTLKDSISLCGNQADAKCSSCERFSHQVQNCPLLHYEIDKEAHIRRYIHNDPQARDEKFTRVKPNFLKWTSRNQGQQVPNTFTLDPITTSPLHRNKDFIHQRFNVFKEYYELRTNLRMMRIKMKDDKDNNIETDEEDLIYNEDDDRQFILKTHVPIYQTIQVHRAKQQIRGIFAEEYETEDDDMFEEEFADYEELMNNGDEREDGHPGSSPILNGPQQSMQRMSTLSSQVHVPTEKSAFIRMPSNHSFHPSGKNKNYANPNIKKKSKKRKKSSEHDEYDEDDEDYESDDKADSDDDDDDDDDDGRQGQDDDDDDDEFDDIIEGTTGGASRAGVKGSQKVKKQQKVMNKKHKQSSQGSKKGGKQLSNANHIVSFREENGGVGGQVGIVQARKGSTHSKMSKDMNVQQLTNEEESVTPKNKSLFFRNIENPQQVQPSLPSPMRYQNRHKSVNPVSSFSGFETYLRSSDAPSSSMNSIVLQQQGSKRKGTILSSIGQGSSKLRNSGSQDFSINIQRTGTLNSRGIIRNSNPILSSKKISDPKTPMSRTKSMRSIKIELREQTRVGPSSTQYVRHQNTQVDALSEKQQAKMNNAPGSLKAELDTLFVIMDFEKICEFTHYLPINNLSNILKQLKRIQKVKIDLLDQRKTLKSFKTAKTSKILNSQVYTHSRREQGSYYHKPSVMYNNNSNNNNTLGNIPATLKEPATNVPGSVPQLNGKITGLHDTYSPDSNYSKSAEKIITLSFQS